MTQPGRLIRMPAGFEAFVPNPLPPQFQWTSKMIHALSDADRAIGRLAGEGRRLPNPHVLMRPFIAREAVLSSRIEGTLATLGELLAAEAGAVVDRSPDDLHEVANYVVALEYGMQQLPNQPLSIRLLQEIHEKLLQGARGDLALPGTIRSVQNWIGLPGSTPHTASYVPPPPSELAGLLHSLEAFFADTSLPPLVQIALTHYQFEAIHPFLDGNGRVGRLLITLFLIQRAILPTPLLYLSAFFEATRSEYITRLHAVTTEGDWENWLLYFVNGVARQSEDAEDRASRITNILDVWRLRVAGLGSETPARVLGLLAGNPFVTAKRVSEHLGVARSTASRAIDNLVKLGIVIQSDDRSRDRAYCAQELLDVMNEPARISLM